MSRHLIPGAPLPTRALRRVTQPRIVARTIEGRAVTREKALVLAELATWPRGTGGLTGRLNGGALSALVQLGLAERQESDRIGGCRYAASDAGLQLLRDLGVLRDATAR